jgi:hypothetical protein
LSFAIDVLPSRDCSLFGLQPAYATFPGKTDIIFGEDLLDVGNRMELPKFAVGFRGFSSAAGSLSGGLISLCFDEWQVSVNAKSEPGQNAVLSRQHGRGSERICVTRKLAFRR